MGTSWLQAPRAEYVRSTTTRRQPPALLGASKRAEHAHAGDRGESAEYRAKLLDLPLGQRRVVVVLQVVRRPALKGRTWYGSERFGGNPGAAPHIGGDPDDERGDER